MLHSGEVICMKFFLQLPRFENLMHYSIVCFCMSLITVKGRISYRRLEDIYPLRKVVDKIAKIRLE